MADELSELARHVRAQDPDRFYAALFAPAGRREALFALLAFNHEIARIRETVSEPALGEMRLQWWRERLDDIVAGRTNSHPVAEALTAAHRAHAFSLDALHALIDARTFDLYDEPMADSAALEAYADATGGGLHRAMAQALGAAEEGERAAQSAGTAWALVGLLRALPLHAARGQIYIPAAILAAHGASTSDILARTRSVAVSGALGEIAALAQTHYLAARIVRSGLALPAILPAALIPLYLRKISRDRGNPFQSSPAPAKFQRMMRLFVAALSSRI